LNSDIDSLESQLDAATNKYESAAQLHTRIITGVHDLEAVVGRLPQGTDFQLHPTDELLAGSGTVRELLEMIQSVNDVCDERQKAFEAEREQLVVQSTTWREEQLEPLRTVLTEVRALSDLLTGFTHITEHGARRDEVEIEQGVLRVQKGRATAVKGMLGSLAGSLTTSQLENAQQLINDATPDINEIFGRVCGNPQYDRIQIDARIQKANIVYSFKALPEQLVLGDVAAAVLSGGNQSVASIAAMMALAAGGTHNFNSLVLDDPCSDMDADTRARWCESASEFAPGRQFIVFTHQQDVAESLEGFGAHRDDLEGWEGGVLPGRRVD
jgi:DNA repair exonuclease SbcCD ATPase subunit